MEPLIECCMHVDKCNLEKKAYQKVRAANEAHEVVALGNAHSFLDGHGRVPAALDYGPRVGGVAFRA